ncbi:hypothetical protein [Streptomyces sp. NPDC059819]|uniref:hypothetical protein n=1 Tax=Streptomyces sp. NPDC059819 TaxID=3346963 RepID=UPI003664B72E
MSTTDYGPAIESRDRLRKALRAADILCTPPFANLDEDDLTDVSNLNAGDAVQLRALLESGAAGEAKAGLAPAPFGTITPPEATAAAFEDLRGVLAGLGITDITLGRTQYGAPTMHIHRVDATGTAALVTLLWTALGQYQVAAAALWTALQGHGLSDIGLRPRVTRLRIEVGELSVPEAAVLAGALDGGPLPDGVLDDEDDPPNETEIAARLREALTGAGCGSPLPLTIDAHCRKCGEGPSVTLPHLSLEDAQTLATALGRSAVGLAEHA